jgi:O-antigen ligase
LSLPISPGSARFIALLLASGMLLLAYFPLHLAAFYVIMRPIVQPFAYLQYTLYGGIPLTSLFSILLIVFGLAVAVFKRGSRLIPPNIVPLYLLVCFSSLSFLNTLDYAMSFAHILKILGALAMYLIVYDGIQSMADARKFLVSLLLASIVPMIFGFYQYYTGTGHAHQEGGIYAGHRIDSLLGEYNAYGEFLAIEICAALMLLFDESGRSRRPLLFFCLLLMIISLFLSLNRGTWISLTAACLFAFALFRKTVGLRQVMIVFLVLGICFSGIILRRFDELGQKGDWSDKNTFAGRVRYWQAALPLVLEHPLVGLGIGTSTLVSRHYLNAGNADPHNDYLRMALETGIPGAVFYLMFLAMEMISCMRRASLKTLGFINVPMLIAVVYFCIISATQNIIYNVIVFPMFLALVALARKVNLLCREASDDLFASR